VIVGAPIEVPTGETGKAQRIAVRELSGVLHSELQRLLDAANAKL